jgi:hypothetical protein
MGLGLSLGLLGVLKTEKSRTEKNWTFENYTAKTETDGPKPNRQMTIFV